MPQWDEAAVLAAQRRLRLALDPRRRRHGVGARLGSGPGASLEFHDHRAYVAGDDLRHLDWAVLARSDQLVLRRHRQEVAPRVEVVLDGSASMALTPQKLTLATTLAALLMALAEADGGRPALWLLTDAPHRLDGHGQWRKALSQATATGAAGLDLQPPPLSMGADRIVVSDGLSPAGGAACVRRWGRDAGRLCLIQVLTQHELAPVPLGAVRLDDAEGGGSIDLIHDEAVCADYRARLERHQAGWQQALHGRGAGLVTCIADTGWHAALDALVRVGVTEVRA